MLTQLQRVDMRTCSVPECMRSPPLTGNTKRFAELQFRHDFTSWLLTASHRLPTCVLVAASQKLRLLKKPWGRPRATMRAHRWELMLINASQTLCQVPILGAYCTCRRSPDHGTTQDPAHWISNVASVLIVDPQSSSFGVSWALLNMRNTRIRGVSPYTPYTPEPSPPSHPQ
jgi:hypothetical protein